VRPTYAAFCFVSFSNVKGKVRGASSKGDHTIRAGNTDSVRFYSTWRAKREELLSMETIFKQSIIQAGNEAAVRHLAKQSFTRLYFVVVSVWHPANQSFHDCHLRLY
jgi:hypothetical protein